MIRLHPDWRLILRRAWSIRFLLLAGALQAVVVFLQFDQPYSRHSPIWFAVAAFAATLGAFISRLVAQAIFRKPDDATANKA
jgi:hypothetical protein